VEKQSTNSLKKWLVWALMLIGVGLYVPSLSGEFFLDDVFFFADNQYVKNFDVGKILTTSTYSGAGLVSNYYRPLTSLSFAVDYQLWGLNPWGWHLTNALLHAGAGVMLFLLFSELIEASRQSIPGSRTVETRSRDLKRGKFQKKGMAKWLNGLMVEEGMALWVAMIFLVHPIQVEAVAFTNSRGDSLYAILLFSGLYLFARSFSNKKQETRNKYLVGSVAFYGLSILAKEIAVAGIGLYALIWVTKLMQGVRLKVKANRLVKLISEYKMQVGVLIANLGVLLTYVYLRATKLNFLSGFNFAPINDIYSQSLQVRVMTMGHIFWEYMKMVVWPTNLHFGREVEAATGLNWWLLGMIGVLGVIGAIGYWEWRKYRTWWVWLGLLWFLIMWAPVSGVVVAMNQKVLEHWMYVPVIGIVVIVYRIVYIVLRNTQDLRSPPAGGSLRYIVYGEIGWQFSPKLQYLLIPLVVWYGYLAVGQMGLWRSQEKLYLNNLKYEQSGLIYNNLCTMYMGRGEYEKAVEACVQAKSRGEMRAYANLASIDMIRGDEPAAVKEYEKAIGKFPSEPMNYQLLVKLLMARGDYEGALMWVERLVVVDPSNWETWLMKGKIEWLAGNVDEAEISLGEAMREATDQDQVVRLISQIRAGR